jgi:hypothetical protein
LTFSCSNFCSHEVKVSFFGYNSKLWSLAHLSLVWASTTYWIDSVRNQYVIGHATFNCWTVFISSIGSWCFELQEMD